MKINELIVKESKLYYLEQMYIDESMTGVLKEDAYDKVCSQISRLSIQDKKTIMNILQRQLGNGLRN